MQQECPVPFGILCAQTAEHFRAGFVGFKEACIQRMVCKTATGCAECIQQNTNRLDIAFGIGNRDTGALGQSLFQIIIRTEQVVTPQRGRHGLAVKTGKVIGQHCNRRLVSNIEFRQNAVVGKLFGFQHFARFFVYLLGGFLGGQGINTENPLQLHPGPIVHRVASQQGEYLAVLFKLFVVSGITGNVLLLHTADTHQTVLIRVGGQPQPGQILKLPVRCHIRHGQVVMKINNGQILGGLIQLPGAFRL